ncbi:uncharacterized protein LOC134257648 [Saccostrea cucullata]|uniref:uncharacterized protein LOC134257648 n=1 Tax=Saccostrea cuccullata TaxID=36930 RepID=UPI002ED64EAA
MALSKAQLPGTPQHFLECGIEDCDRNCEFYCNICHTRLCKQCRDEHLRNPETKTHEVVLYQQRKRQLPTEKCKIHPTKDIELLCEECKIPICSKCKANQAHRGHTFIDLESIYSEKFSHCQEEIAKIHEYFLPTSQDIQKEIKDNATEIKKIMDDIRTSMKAEAESLKSLVDKVTSENMEEVNKIEQSLLEKLNSQDTTIEKYITHLNDLDKKFHVYMSSLKPTKLFTAEDMKIEPIPETTKPEMPVFTAGKNRKEDIAKLLGKVSFPNIKEEVKKVQPLKSKTPKSNPKSTNYQVMKDSKTTSNVKQALSLSSSVTEVRMLVVIGISGVYHMSLDQSGRLWVSDRDGNLVQIDQQGWNQLQKIQTSGGEGYHTVTKDGDLIFTDRNKKVINRITQDNNITKFIKTGDWVPISIHSSHINGNLLVGMRKNEQAKVTRYNKKGKELQNIQKDNKGQGLYSYPHYITENINGDICTSDYGNAVVVVNKSGQHRFSYTGQKSKFDPFGICTDVLGHILVCDAYSVQLLDQDGQFLSLLITTEEVPSPISVCVDDEKNLCVGDNMINTITAFKYLQMNTE